MKPLSLLCLLAPTAAIAHAGDHSHATLMHFLTEPDHLGGLAVLLVAGVLVATKLRVRR